MDKGPTRSKHTLRSIFGCRDAAFGFSNRFPQATVEMPAPIIRQAPESRLEVRRIAASKCLRGAEFRNEPGWRGECIPKDSGKRTYQIRSSR